MSYELTYARVADDDVTLLDEDPLSVERDADQVLVHVLCDHEALWTAVDAAAARAIFERQLADAIEGVVDLDPLCRYVLEVGVPRRAAAVFLVDLASALDGVGLVAAVPSVVDDILDGFDAHLDEDPRFQRAWG